MSKKADFDEKAKSMNSNIEGLTAARDAPNTIETVINNFFAGEKVVIDGVTKEAKPIGRKEVFFFGLSVPEKSIDVIYGQDSHQQGVYDNIPKFYRDNNGNLQNYNNATELKEIAAKITEAVAIIGENASKYYSYESKQKLGPLLFAASQDGTRVLSSESALANIDAAISTAEEKYIKEYHIVQKKDDAKYAPYIEANLDVGYQKILDNLNKTLETYKELANIVKKEPTIAYASDVSIAGDKPIPNDYYRVLSNAIINQRAITGLDPADKDFKTNLNNLDPKSLGKIELSFTDNAGGLVYNTQIKGKHFKKLLSEIDPEKLKEFDLKGDPRLWKTQELSDTRKEIKNNLTEAKITENDLKTYFTKIKLDKIKPEKIIAYTSDVSITGNKPTNDDYHKALSNAVINQIAITHLNPSNEDFKTKLSDLDPKSLGKIELRFTDANGALVTTTEIKGKKFKELLNKIDREKLTEFAKGGKEGEVNGVKDKIKGELANAGVNVENYKKKYFSKIKLPKEVEFKEEKPTLSNEVKSPSENDLETQKKISELKIVSPEEAFKILKDREQNKEVQMKEDNTKSSGSISMGSHRQKKELAAEGKVDQKVQQQDAAKPSGITGSPAPVKENMNKEPEVQQPASSQAPAAPQTSSPQKDEVDRLIDSLDNPWSSNHQAKASEQGTVKGETPSSPIPEKIHPKGIGPITNQNELSKFMDSLTSGGIKPPEGQQQAHSSQKQAPASTILNENELMQLINSAINDPIKGQEQGTVKKSTPLSPTSPIDFNKEIKEITKLSNDAFESLQPTPLASSQKPARPASPAPVPENTIKNPTTELLGKGWGKATPEELNKLLSKDPKQAGPVNQPETQPPVKGRFGNALDKILGKGTYQSLEQGYQSIKQNFENEIDKFKTGIQHEIDNIKKDGEKGVSGTKIDTKNIKKDLSTIKENVREDINKINLGKDIKNAVKLIGKEVKGEIEKLNNNKISASLIEKAREMRNKIGLKKEEKGSTEKSSKKKESAKKKSSGHGL